MRTCQNGHVSMHIGLGILFAAASLAGCGRTSGVQSSLTQESEQSPYVEDEKWRRICPGKEALTRWYPQADAKAAGVWKAETPFVFEKLSSNGQFALGIRGHDKLQAWVPVDKVCALDHRRRVCNTDQTDLFWKDTPDDKSGRLITKGAQVKLIKFSPRRFAKIEYNGTNYWMWQKYLCPVDPNISSRGAGSFAKTTPTGAFLSTIAYAEGTDDRYDFIFTFATFSGWSDHPRQVMCSGGLCSDAAGRYQILSTTWDDVVQPSLRLPDFSPTSQDKAGLFLVKNRGVNNAERQLSYAEFESAIYKLNLEWASLPGSPYGQPTRSMAELWQKYQLNLQGD